MAYDIGLRAYLRNKRQAARNFLIWLRDDFTRMPGFAAFSWRRHLVNRRFFTLNRTADALDAALTFEPDIPRDISKTVWIYWAQGEANAPHIVRRCIESWRTRNPGWEIVVLDSEKIGAYAHLSDVPSFLPHRLYADTLRLRLLDDHGGIWADATCYCHRPLDEWLPLAASRGFFAFSEPGPDRSIDNWFIAAEKGGALIGAWRRQFDSYIAHRTATPVPYFIAMYAFDFAVRRDAELAELWRKTPRIPAGQTFLLFAALRGVIPLDAAAKAIGNGLPVSKLSWKFEFEEEAIARIFARLPR